MGRVDGERTRSRLALGSLRMRLTAWSALFTLVCLGLCGIALEVYLRYALSASRSESMRKRDQRLVRFLETELRTHPQDSWNDRMQHFLEATPETDLVEIDNGSGGRLYPGRDPAPGLERTAAPCREPCLSTTMLQGHHVRVLTHSTVVAGKPIRLILIGSVDEHYDILHVISVALVGLTPFVLLGSVLGGYSLSRRALHSMGEMTAQAQGLSLTNLQARFPEPDWGDQLQQLARAWNDMLARLEQSAASVTQFTADASHDLRTALTVILANAQLALRRERSPESYRESLEGIATETSRVLHMLEDMLLATRSGVSPHGLDHTQVDLPEVLRETFEAAQAVATLREQRFVLEMDLTNLSIRGDRASLRRLFSILVDNAMKYTPHGGSVRMRLCGHARGWVLEVMDTGIGIAPELQGRIFERLFRGDPARSQNGPGGHGLGLAIAAWIAEIHHLDLSLTSVPGQGSTFRLRPASR